MCFFFKQKTAYEMRISDWRSDVCSSDLEPRLVRPVDIEGAVPDRGQEDDGHRTRRAARLEPARRHLLSDRWRYRPHRYVEGVRDRKSVGTGKRVSVRV